MSHPGNRRAIASGWHYRGKPLMQARRELYDEPDPNPPYGPEVKTIEEREVLFWPAVETALFLVDPKNYGYPVIWFPTFGHGTSEPFEEFPREPGEVSEEIMLGVAQRASAGIADRDSRLAAVSERLRTG